VIWAAVVTVSCVASMHFQISTFDLSFCRQCATINIGIIMRTNTIRAPWLFSLALAGLLGLCMVPTASAVTSTSPNYQVNESFFGTGGELDASSATYRSKQSAGELTVGAMRSTIYSAQAGFNTDRTPYIAMATLTSTVDIGVLDTSRANVGTAQFWVKAYLAEGYVVQSYGGPPSIPSHTLTTSGTAFTSSSGTEQFGINLAANNNISGAKTGTPLSVVGNFGAAPTQFPNYAPNPFGFGQVNSNYTTVNNFRYINGDTIANSPSSSSDTTYTISYLFNMSPVTPAGTYIMNHSIVATATY